MFKRIDHVEIVTADMDRAIRFYTDILGFKLRERRKVESPVIDEISYVELGDTLLELLSAKEPSTAPSASMPVGYRMMALEVEDMDKAVKYLRGKGVQISREPVAIGKSKRGEIKDSDGLSIELRQW